MWLVITPERHDKTFRMMHALHIGSGKRWQIIDRPPPRGEPFVVWGHRWMAERIVPRAIADGTEWWLIDNGYHLPAGGQATGFYSITRNGVSPAMVRGDPRRLPVHLAPWRHNRDGYVLLAMPGDGFGRMLGINITRWRAEIFDRIRAHTDRPIKVRDKGCPRPLAQDLAGASVLVTHSSKVAVDAVRMGVPVIVEPTNPAAPVGSINLADIETPRMVGRRDWWASLMAQQFSLDEMRAGVAHRAMDVIREAQS